ncbi:MAG: transketolase [Syntrophorhabdaceae bacterium]
MDTLSIEIRKSILTISHHSGHGHIPTCFSIIELLRAIYESMNHDPANPTRYDRDLFILSKGHGALGLYCTLAHFGYFPIQDVYKFGAFGSNFGCHGDRLKVPGIELSTGSLGHGIGVATGMALGLKMSGSSRKVYVLVGDGESNEGTVWESLMVAANRQLDNLTVLFDNNRSQSRCLPLVDPEKKFDSFGCDVSSVDGHDVGAIHEALLRQSGKPHVIVGHTVKGAGCRTLVNDVFAWHRRSPDARELEMLLGELHETAI